MSTNLLSKQNLEELERRILVRQASPQPVNGPKDAETAQLLDDALKTLWALEDSRKGIAIDRDTLWRRCEDYHKELETTRRALEGAMRVLDKRIGDNGWNFELTGDNGPEARALKAVATRASKKPAEGSKPALPQAVIKEEEGRTLPMPEVGTKVLMCAGSVLEVVLGRCENCYLRGDRRCGSFACLDFAGPSAIFRRCDEQKETT